jgi:hypothetical protein
MLPPVPDEAGRDPVLGDEAAAKVAAQWLTSEDRACGFLAAVWNLQADRAFHGMVVLGHSLGKP